MREFLIIDTWLRGTLNTYDSPALCISFATLNLATGKWVVQVYTGGL